MGLQFSKLQYTAQLHGWTKFASMQNQYSLMQREDEREMFGLLADQGVGSIPWSPLAKGRLARPWGEQTARSETDNVARWVLPHDDKLIADAVQAIAGERGVPMAQIALAWVLKNPVVSAPIVGATRPGHLTDAAAALDIRLTDEEVRRLEAPYTPRMPTGARHPLADGQQRRVLVAGPGRIPRLPGLLGEVGSDGQRVRVLGA